MLLVNTPTMINEEYFETYQMWRLIYPKWFLKDILKQFQNCIISSQLASEGFENIPRKRFSWSHQFTEFLHLPMTPSVPNNLWNFLGMILVFTTSFEYFYSQEKRAPRSFQKGPQFLTLRHRHPGHSVTLLIDHGYRVWHFVILHTAPSQWAILSA